MERKLATIRKISSIDPIEGADKIELATVDGWKVIVAKDVGHKVGDLVVYCEIDSFLPIRDEFEFLRKSSYKKISDGSEGFRLKTIRLRGQMYFHPSFKKLMKKEFKTFYNHMRVLKMRLFMSLKNSMEVQQPTILEMVNSVFAHEISI